MLDLIVENDEVIKVKVDMGEPILEHKKIPVICEDNIKNNLNLKVLDKNFSFTCVSMGNPHAVTFINDEVKNFDVQKYGKIIENLDAFPQRTNVEFINIVDKNNVSMRVWERGAGETLACGTGACASVVASVINEYTSRKVFVHLLGGILEIEWSDENNHVYMTGPAVTVFEGVLTI